MPLVLNFPRHTGAVSAAHLQQQYALVDGGWDVDVVPLSLPPLPPLPDQPPLPGAAVVPGLLLRLHLVLRKHSIEGSY